MDPVLADVITLLALERLEDNIFRGESRDIGSEIDVIGVWTIDDVELKLVFGAFFPGNAFPSDADTAFFTQLRLQVTF